jgi:acyl carrier protein
MASVEERIFELARENRDLGRDPDWDLTFGESDVSSMDVVAFVKLLDPEFGIEIPPDSLAEVDNLRKLAKVVADLAG